MFPLLAQLCVAIACATIPHPHVPKAIVLGGAGGKITTTYFTVPYNPAHLKELAPGFQWHLGYANLVTEAQLVCGDTQIPSGKYKLDIRLVEGTTWVAVLKPAELSQLELAVRRASRQDAAAQEKAKKDLEEYKAARKTAGLPEQLVLPTTAFQAGSEEHLVMSACSQGYEAVERNSSDPKGGIEFTLRMGWGELHRELALKEVFAGTAQSRPQGRGR